MKRLGWLGFVVAALAAIARACGGGSPPPSTSDPGGHRRAHLRQRAARLESGGQRREPSSRRFGTPPTSTATRVELTDVSCGGLSRCAFSCSSRMPAMAPGAHTIELASFVTDGGVAIESGRSAPLRVTVTGATAGGAVAVASGCSRRHTPDDGRRRRAAPRRAVRAAGMRRRRSRSRPDGRVFVAEQGGRVRILVNGVLDPEPAITIDEVLMTRASEGGLLALALDAQFDRTHFVVCRIHGRRPGGHSPISRRPLSARSGAGWASASCSSTRYRRRRGPQRRSTTAPMAGSMSRSTPPPVPGGHRHRRPTAGKCFASAPTAPRRRISRPACRCSRPTFNRLEGWIGIP